MPPTGRSAGLSAGPGTAWAKTAEAELGFVALWKRRRGTLRTVAQQCRRSETMGKTTRNEVLWTVADAARFMRLSEKHVYRLVETDRMPHYKIGTRVRLARKHVERYLSDRRKG